MQQRTLDEWLKYYEDHCKLPAPHNKPGPYPKGSKMIWDPERGYAVFQYMPEHNTLKLHELAGDGEYWVDFAIHAAKELGCSHVAARTPRRILSWCKALKAEIIHKQELDGNNCRRVVKYKGDTAICSEYNNKDGITITYITFYLNKNTEV